jgi:hypothetical protein
MKYKMILFVFLVWICIAAFSYWYRYTVNEIEPQLVSTIVQSEYVDISVPLYLVDLAQIGILGYLIEPNVNPVAGELYLPPEYLIEADDRDVLALEIMLEVDQLDDNQRKELHGLLDEILE